MFAADGETVKVIDFGGAEANLSQKEKMVYGSVNYMDPRVTQQDGGYDPFRADMWSAGCLLFKLVTGKNVFPNLDSAKLVDMHKEIMKQAELP